MDASPDEPGPPAPTAPTGSPLGRVPARQAGRGIRALSVLAATFLLLAIAKPWDWGPPRPSPPAARAIPAATPAAAPSATAARSPVELAEDVCLGTGAWRVATVETWRLVIDGKSVTQRVRVWRAVAPTTEPIGPDDPRIPIVPVAAMQVDALGWCAPSAGADEPTGPVTVALWRLPAASQPGSRAIELVRLRRIAPSQGQNDFAALYREVTDCVAGFGCSGSGVPLLAAGWAAGRYVFEYRDTGDGTTRWFGADIQVLPAPA